MARRSEHSLQQIKDMIIDATEAIIDAGGVETLTVRNIAKSIGYTVGTIYMLFFNLQDLLVQVKGRTLDQMAADLQQAENGNDVEQRIRALALAYLSFANRNYHRWRMIFEQGHQPEQRIPEWYTQKIEQIFVPIEALFQQLSPENSEEQVRLAARTLWCSVHGVCMLSLNGNLGRVGVEDAEAAVGLLVDNFIRGWKQ